MTTDTILEKWSDDNGDLFRIGKAGSRYFIETITPAFRPHAGEVSRYYVTEAEADEFDPDPLRELFWEQVQ